MKKPTPTLKEAKKLGPGDLIIAIGAVAFGSDKQRTIVNCVVRGDLLLWNEPGDRESWPSTEWVHEWPIHKIEIVSKKGICYDASSDAVESFMLRSNAKIINITTK